GDIFFFSSRRRHTRFSRDWSSDVCSSDLEFLTPALCTAWQLLLLLLAAPLLQAAEPGADALRQTRLEDLGRALFFDVNLSNDRRSEERRVGKECRYGGSPARETHTVYVSS